jgi:hypothetical protein
VKIYERRPLSAMMNRRSAPLEGVFDMAVEVVIQRALDYGHACGWDHRGQDELALCALQNVRPEWSEIEALSAVDWVRSLAPIAVPAA